MLKIKMYKKWQLQWKLKQKYIIKNIKNVHKIYFIWFNTLNKYFI